MDNIENFAKNNFNSTEFQKYSTEQMESCQEDITKLLYECLEKIYPLVVKFVKKNYPEVEFEKINVASLTWNKDGLTLEERIKKHLVDSSQKLLELYKDGVIDYDSVQKILDIEIVRIMDTESYIISNTILHDKLKKVSKYFEILGGNCCEYCDEHISGIQNITQLEDIPPFHPNCQCMVIYYINKPE